MTHKAFTSSPVLEWKSLPFQIESLDTVDTKLLIGTSKGQLLVYNVPHKQDPSGRFKVDLQDTKKTFSKKPIVQLDVVERFKLLLSLSDTYVCVHDLNTYSEHAKLERTKGATFYAVDVQDRNDPEADTHRRSDSFRLLSPRDLKLKLAVVVRKKLITFEWVHQAQKFLEKKEINLPDQPKVVAWAGDNLIVGLKKEYLMVNENTGQISEILKAGQTGQEISITRLPGNEFLLGKDDISVFVGLNCNPTRKYAVRWSEQPITLDLVEPYAVGLTSKDVEIRTLDEAALVQRLDLPKAKFIRQDKAVYVASPSNCWRLEPVPLNIQIAELLQISKFDEALALAELVDESDAQKEDRKFKIERQQAFSMFSKKNFEQAIRTFGKLKMDPTHVIGLYPDLLKAEVRDKFKYPMRTPTLVGAELETALNFLIEYLTQKRHEMGKRAEREAKHPVESGGEVVVNPENDAKLAELNQTIDTTLLKCYLKTNPALVGSLLRVQNFCDVAESEVLLKEHERFQELVSLYNNRGLHRKALELLYDHGQRKGKLSGHFNTMIYLQRLGPDHFDLILEFSKWVLKMDAEDGYSIFASDDYPEIAKLPHDKVLEHLQKHGPSLVVRYLEHVIDSYKSDNPALHNKLLQLYLERVVNPMQQYLRGLSGTRPTAPGSEPGDLGLSRKKLLRFLDTSMHYTPQKMISTFLQIEGLYEERAILLGRIGRHDQALSIYAHKLKDPEKAEEYCQKQYELDSEGSKDVFHKLLEIYLKPKEGAKENVPAALAVLRRHYDQIDTEIAMQLLPLTTKVSDIHSFLASVMRNRFAARRQGLVLMNLLKAERLQVNTEYLSFRSKRTTIEEDRLCTVCRKPIRTSAFYLHPTGIVVHLNCAEDEDAMDEIAKNPDAYRKKFSSSWR
eukprot:m.173140 g.173140  ORF g.173140 m.173140 type:complete len:903 (-) comp31717_c4_seq1:125-2833(-)